MILFLTFIHAGAPATQHRDRVSAISLNLESGIEKLNTSGRKYGRAETSSIPMKQCLPPRLFSLTSEVIVDEQPDPNGD
ncbi:MAG: hypothetical protein U0L83_09765 [Muribaculaceae bacterium]|nr:hypothetical protein [Muribaculaceae bacterium]